MSNPPFGSWPPPLGDGITTSDFVLNASTMVPGASVTDALNNLLRAGPARTFFVASSWLVTSDPARQFTDPQAALTAAAALLPTQDAPVVIIIYPGVYTQNLTLVSNVHLFGFTTNGTRLTGTVTWTAGAGVNAPQAAIRERIYMRGLRFEGAWSIDATAKTASFAELVQRAVNVLADFTYLGRALTGGQDFLVMSDGVNTGTTWLLKGIVPNLYGGCSLGAASITLQDCLFGSTLEGIATFNPLNLVNSPGTSGNGNAFADINVDATSALITAGSNMGTLTVAAGGMADVRKSTYTALAGLGSINRDTILLSAGPTAIGANAIAIAPPLMDATYNAILTLVAGALALTGVTVTAKTAAGFTLTDPAGGHTFDVTIQHP